MVYMGIEIERKFLVDTATFAQGTPPWLNGIAGAHCRQGYLALGPPVAVRVRVMDGRGTVNIKKATTEIVRDEFEYEIPVSDVEHILDGLCTGCIIEKTRYLVPYAGMTWEVDVFEGANQDLIVAEIELDDEHQAFEKPPWLGEEVSHDPRYFNSSLTQHPYAKW